MKSAVQHRRRAQSAESNLRTEMCSVIYQVHKTQKVVHQT